MAEKKKERYSSYALDQDPKPGTPQLAEGRDGKNMRKISPLGLRVLVRLRKDNNVTDSGLYLPEGAKQNMQESLLAEVVEVASAIDEDTHEEANVSGIPLGALVLLPKEAGTKIPWDEELRLVDTKHILAIVHEISVS